MLKRKIAKIKWMVGDLRTQFLRNLVSTHRGRWDHDLRDYQTYPRGGNLDPNFFMQPNSSDLKIIESDTPITSIGSCFAVEIRQHLRDAKFNFISTRESWAGSAEWGRVYTIKNLLQIFQYTFTELLPEDRFFRGPKGYFDPYREGPLFSTEAEANNGFLEHYEESRQALTSCKILIVTPGQNEAWIDQTNGLAWARKPPLEVIQELGSDRFCIKRFSLEENIQYLDSALELLWAHNPETQVIFTVSPVPSDSTFYDTNVAVRSFENKAILLLAVKGVVEKNPDRTHYFPSFEMSILSHNLNLQLDNRHVKPKIVQKIMDCFDHRFVAEE